MLKKIIPTALVAGLSAGCVTVPMEGKEAANKAKQFNAPSQGQAGLYIFRTGGPGGALKKDIWVDGNCIGESAPNVFFFTEVAGNQEHVISTESEFSPNVLKLIAESDKNYFVQQYIKMGVFVGGANLKLVDQKTGEDQVRKLGMATRGTCSANASQQGTTVRTSGGIAMPVKTSPPPVTAQTPPVAEPPQPAEPAEQTVQYEAGQDVILSATGLLYDGPTPRSRATELPVGTEIVLKESLINASGTWWFVSTQGQIGWLMESNLEQDLAVTP